MKNYLIFLFYNYFIFTFIISISASELNIKYESTAEEELFKAWTSNKNPESDFITTWFISEGNDDSLSLKIFKDKFYKLMYDLKSKLDLTDDQDDIAEEIFIYLHENVFKWYSEYAEFKDVFRNGTFSNLTGSALYFLVCSEFGIKIDIVYSPYYLYLKLFYDGEEINIEIMDRNTGFDKSMPKDFLIKTLVRLSVINTYEYQTQDQDMLFNKYFGGLNPIEPIEFSSAIYNSRGKQFIQLGNLEGALQQFEKAVIINPNNGNHVENYKYALFNLSDMMRPYDRFVPYLKNAFWILNDDPTFVDVALLMTNNVIQHYADYQRDFAKTLRVLYSFKTNYLNDKFLNIINEKEMEVRYNWAVYHFKRGNYYIAFLKMKTIYFEDKSTPKYKDDYVDFALAYINSQMRNMETDESTIKLLDTLYTEAPDYHQVKNMYVNVLFAPFVKNLNTNLKKAKYAAHKIYKKFPNHRLAREAISSIYHKLAMEQLRKNNMKEAFKLLVKGLDMVPESDILNESFNELERM